MTRAADLGGHTGSARGRAASDALSTATCTPGTGALPDGTRGPHGVDTPRQISRSAASGRKKSSLMKHETRISYETRGKSR